MKTKVILFLALGSAALLSADYQDSGRQQSCPGGNCPYQRQQSPRDSSSVRNYSGMPKGQMSARQDNGMTESDRRINENIRENLKEWFSDGYEAIILNTNNGVVTILGFVESPEDLDKINNEAKNVEGVKSVNNKASIQQRR